jgi:3-oxoadipate enol-lactonase
MTVTMDGPADAPPVVLSNALGTTIDMWSPQVPALAGERRVLRYDHAPRSSVEDLASDVACLLDDLGLERVSFCGLSLGAMVGMTLAVEQPRRIDRLVLASTSARFGVREEWHERAALVRAEGMRAVAEDALDKWLTPAYPDREPFLRMQLSTPREDYARGLEAVGDFDFRDRLGLITQPTLVVVGSEDEATPFEDAKLIADRVPGSRMLVLEGAAHLANVEQPAAFAAAVLEHLR